MTGGIVGDVHHNTNYILDCFNLAAMSGPNGGPGGIVGRANAASSYIRNCYFAGSGSLGGNIYAQNVGTPTVQNCYYKAVSYTAPGASATNQQTGLTESQMKNGMMTGLLNTMDGAAGTVTDSLRASGRVWYQDRATPAFNSGYPMFIQSDYRNWQEVGAEVANGAGAAAGGTPMAGAKPSGDGSSGSPYQIGTPEQLAWFMYLTNSDNAANGGACVELKQDMDLFGSKYSGYTAVSYTHLDVYKRQG